MPPAGLSSAVLPAAFPALHSDSDGHCSDRSAGRSGSDHHSDSDHSAGRSAGRSDSGYPADRSADHSDSDRSDSAGSAAKTHLYTLASISPLLMGTSCRMLHL